MQPVKKITMLLLMLGAFTNALQAQDTIQNLGIGSPTCDTPKLKKPFVRRKVVWFTPSGANEIKGVNFSIETMNVNDDPLTVQGLNLNAGFMSFFVGALMLPRLGAGNALMNLPDTISSQPALNKIKGVSISGGGLVFDAAAKGLIINGVICGAERTRGLVITGTQNMIADFKGVTISALRNRSAHGKGVQIGLLNICKHLKGVQIGLWNVNSKRKLPFFNWSGA
jgi:hypothetical protein